MSALIGKKLGMSRIFDEQGQNIPVTILEVGPCFVTQIKTSENDGYNAVQLGFFSKREKLVTKPLLGHFNKAKVAPQGIIKEFRDYSNSEELKLGTELKADVFNVGDSVTITGTSKGKGFAGCIKRHGFSRGLQTHGQSDRLRAPGSIGQSSYPSRVLKGTRMSGRMGGDKVTIKKVEIVKIDLDNNILLVKGAVPGAKQGIVYIKKQ